MTTTKSHNRSAREEALKQVSLPHNLAPATVSYSTYGHLLICGPEDLIRLAADQLHDMASITLLITEQVSNTDSAHIESALQAAQDLTAYSAQLKSVKGYLGQFQLTIEHQGEQAELAKIALQRSHFDLILNLGQDSLFTTELKPAGYFHITPELPLAQVITELPGYIGEFEKPRYFQINNDICAHTNRGLDGCNRCLDVCPADAISVTAGEVSITPQLCHGAGGCATACPTGAISYALPQPVLMHEYLHKLLLAYRNAGGETPVILFHDHEQGAQLVQEISNELPDNLIPVQLEEIAAAGQETWFAALASGAAAIWLLDSDATPDVVRSLLRHEINISQQILTGLQYSSQQIQLVTPELFSAPISQLDLQTVEQPLDQAISSQNKRDTLFSALKHLQSGRSLQQAFIPLPKSAAFGRVEVAAKDCTLCLSCVSVCPSQALSAGGDTPALHFTEQQCVQCGLCEQACPENVISLTQGLSLDPKRTAPRTLHAEEAFACVRCSKPFAPRSTVEKMVEKLSEHRFFAGEAINRLKMCEDCRVEDIYSDLTAHPEKQLEL